MTAYFLNLRLCSTVLDFYELTHFSLHQTLRKVLPLLDIPMLHIYPCCCSLPLYLTKSSTLDLPVRPIPLDSSQLRWPGPVDRLKARRSVH